MTHKYAFEKLSAWQDAKNLAILVYGITKIYPDEEKYGLISQIRRCSISVCSNIAEGSSRSTKNDQAHFYTMAYGSLMELLNQCIISYELSFISESHYTEIRIEIEKISYKVNELRNSILRKKA